MLRQTLGTYLIISIFLLFNFLFSLSLSFFLNCSACRGNNGVKPILVPCVAYDYIPRHAAIVPPLITAARTKGSSILRNFILDTYSPSMLRKEMRELEQKHRPLPQISSRSPTRFHFPLSPTFARSRQKMLPFQFSLIFYVPFFFFFFFFFFPPFQSVKGI